MKKLLFVLAAAALIVSCQSKGNKSEMIVESEEDSIYMVNDSTLGDMQTYTYQGMLPAADAEGIDYLLVIESAAMDSTGTYTLTTTYIGADNGKNKTFTDRGRKVVKRGIPNNPNAIVYELMSNDGDETVYFLAEGDSTLTMVNKDYQKANSKLNYTLKRKK